MFVEHARRIEKELESAPESLKGDRMVTSATDIACAIGVLLVTGAFIGWLVLDALSKIGG